MQHAFRREDCAGDVSLDGDPLREHQTGDDHVRRRDANQSASAHRSWQVRERQQSGSKQREYAGEQPGQREHLEASPVYSKHFEHRARDEQ